MFNFIYYRFLKNLMLSVIIKLYCLYITYEIILLLTEQAIGTKH